MSSKFISNLFFIIILSAGIYFWATWVIATHPTNAIISWDEGFHGGAALFISESLRNNFAFKDYTYILNDFKNGVIWYPPLWLILAGTLGAVFGPSVEIYRIATLMFSIFSIILIVYFVKRVLDFKAAAIAGLTLAFVPTFVVYSHLMMREVPLLFAVSFTLLAFYRYLTRSHLSSVDLLLTAAAFSIGVLAKIIGIVLIFGTVSGFGLLLFVFYRKSEIWQRFYSRWTLVFLITAVLTFLIYRQFTISVLNADPLLFHLEQTKQMVGDQSTILIVLLNTVIKSLRFYLADFFHMPVLTVLWVGSFFAYVVLKRSLLSYFLLTWIIVTYLSFTAVKPQAVQYIMSIFAPLAIGTGLFWGEFLKNRNVFLNNILFILLIFATIWLGLLHFDKTETIFWRTLITNQEKAVQYVVENAKDGERVISSGDGTRFLIRLLGFNKRLQTINGAALICPESVQDSTEWAIMDYGPQNPIRLKGIINNNFWVRQTSFENSIEEISIFKNTINTNKITLKASNLATNRCIRFLSLGKNKITIVATMYIKNDTYFSNSDLKIALKVNPLKTIAELSLNQDELKRNSGKEKVYNILANQQKINQPTYIFFIIPENITFDIKRIEILNEKD